MPIIKRAKKKLRHDRAVTKRTAEQRKTLRTAVKAYRAKPTVKTLDSAMSVIDKATKFRVIHKNKAARLKSRLAKLTAAKKTA
jgi:small subunit ribosomal protein S20